MHKPKYQIQLKALTNKQQSHYIAVKGQIHALRKILSKENMQKHLLIPTADPREYPQ